MIRVRRSDDRGQANHDWLETRYTFSFADYHDADHMGHGSLRVLNEDRVAPGRGFPTHGHRDMEIVTYVLEGALEHRDSMGNGSVLRPGEVQLMSAGTGVTHSEFNPSSDEPLHLLQMWILPARVRTEPRYEQKEFTTHERRGRLRLVVSPDGADESLTIGQNARMYVSLLAPGDAIRHEVPPDQTAWLHVARGALRLADDELGAGDGAAIDGAFELTADADSELVLWETPR
ncbi:MAG: pirin family protein [Planctomycetota bacterium]